MAYEFTKSKERLSTVKDLQLPHYKMQKVMTKPWTSFSCFTSLTYQDKFIQLTVAGKSMKEIISGYMR